MTTLARGTFVVSVLPLPASGPGTEASVGRMSIDKVFQGDLTGTSKGEMLAVMSSVKGSAGYVAMERITGTLLGRTGSFVLQHSSTMRRGTPQQSITVVPDSGTDRLIGLYGTMVIVISGDQHSYEFDYTFTQGEKP